LAPPPPSFCFPTLFGFHSIFYRAAPSLMPAPRKREGVPKSCVYFSLTTSPAPLDPSFSPGACKDFPFKFSPKTRLVIAFRVPEPLLSFSPFLPFPFSVSSQARVKNLATARHLSSLPFPPLYFERSAAFLRISIELTRDSRESTKLTPHRPNSTFPQTVFLSKAWRTNFCSDQFYSGNPIKGWCTNFAPSLFFSPSSSLF